MSLTVHVRCYSFLYFVVLDLVLEEVDADVAVFFCVVVVLADFVLVVVAFEELALVVPAVETLVVVVLFLRELVVDVVEGFTEVDELLLLMDVVAVVDVLDVTDPVGNGHL